MRAGRTTASVAGRWPCHRLMPTIMSISSNYRAPSIAALSGAASCGICLEPLDNSCSVTRCAHQFHSTCLYRWVAQARRGPASCPMCRTALPNAIHLLVADEPLQSPPALRFGVGDRVTVKVTSSDFVEGVVTATWHEEQTEFGRRRVPYRIRLVATMAGDRDSYVYVPCDDETLIRVGPAEVSQFAEWDADTHARRAYEAHRLRRKGYGLD